MNQFAYRLPFGAEVLGSGLASFRIWAPDLTELHLEIEGEGSYAMQRDDGGWWHLVCNADIGARYRYRIDSALAVPDPAARLQSEDVHGWSVLIDPRDYRWRRPSWRGRRWHEIVIYELHVGCCGGFAGVEDQLHRLAQLGVTAIELMPIGDFSGKRNWGYDGVLPFAPDTAYGSPTQLKQLIDRAHEYGLCVYLDVVYNHFGPDGNYLGRYASAFFAEDKNPQWGDPIDFSQPNVRDFFTHNALYWLHEYRFDGLRLDAAHAISDPSWLDEMAARVRAFVEPDRHVHLMLENERNCATHLSGNFDAQWNDDFHNVMHVLLTHEREGYYQNYIDHPEQKLARSLAEGFIYQGEPSPTHANKPRGEPSAALPPTAFINFLQNHDQIGNRAFGERLTLLANEHDLRAAITLQLLMPAIPLLFMGEPWLDQAPFLFFTDFNGELADAVRAGRRQEFCGFTAFQDEQRRAQIPDPNALDTFTSSIPKGGDDFAKGDRALKFYGDLLAFRHRHIIPRLEHCWTSSSSVIGTAAVSASWRFGDGAQLHIAINLSDLTLPIEPLRISLLFTSIEGGDTLAAAGLLRPHCAIATLREPAAALRKP